VKPGLVVAPLETTWEAWRIAQRAGAQGAPGGFADPLLPLEVEIGPGDDDFLIESALAHPERNWLGIEYSRKRVRRLARRAAMRGVSGANLRLVWRPAADLVRPFLTPARVAAWHVYFPDPWPKAHHARYRLVTPAFANDLSLSLVSGGRVSLATDSEAYAREMAAAFGAAEGLHPLLPPPGYVERAAGERNTVFEERWRRAGRRVFRLEYERADPACRTSSGSPSP
jgi:tRNA (guanine-N7-)-methyltransferase